MMLILKECHMEFMKVLNEKTKYRIQVAGIFETIAKKMLSKGPAIKRKRVLSLSESDKLNIQKYIH